MTQKWDAAGLEQFADFSHLSVARTPNARYRGALQQPLLTKE
jgi:hypothetical protein